jgi:pimeloyl-ACP methyl ester carboxylesterase
VTTRVDRLVPATVRSLGLAAASCIAMLLPSGEARAQATVEMRDTCFFEVPEDSPALDLECGYVVLPENPDRADGPEVRLGFLRLPARSEATAAPLFMLAGGPGQSLIAPSSLLLFSDAFLGPLLDTGDVVILDQRGAPNSIPELDCPNIYGFPWVATEEGYTPDEIRAAGRELMDDCVADARYSGIDLAQYNSVRIAADVDAARTAMGYDRIVYYGASYGAQLGQHVMRDFPDSLEAVILDGANSLSRRSWVEERVRDADVALQRLDALCEADARCGETFDIPAMIDAAMVLFDEGPITTSYQDPEDPGTVIDVTLTDRDMAGLIFGFQTGQIQIHSLPAILDAILAEGRTSAAAILGEMSGSAILASRGATQGELAMLMHMAVVCSDDPVTKPSDMIVEPDASRYARAYGASALEEYLDFCSAIDVPALPDSTDIDVTTDVPTLILAGALDARTPAIRSELVAESLPRATIVVFPGGTHVQLGEVNLCAGDILLAFLGDPDAVPDAGCIAEMPRRGFVLPDGTMSLD